MALGRCKRTARCVASVVLWDQTRVLKFAVTAPPQVVLACNASRGPLATAEEASHVASGEAARPQERVVRGRVRAGVPSVQPAAAAAAAAPGGGNGTAMSWSAVAARAAGPVPDAAARGGADAYS